MHLQQLWRAARDKVSAERWGDYSFATFDSLYSREFQNARWVTAGNGLVPLLYDAAFSAEASEQAERLKYVAIQ